MFNFITKTYTRKYIAFSASLLLLEFAGLAAVLSLRYTDFNWRKFFDLVAISTEERILRVAVLSSILLPLLFIPILLVTIGIFKDKLQSKDALIEEKEEAIQGYAQGSKAGLSEAHEAEKKKDVINCLVKQYGTPEMHDTTTFDKTLENLKKILETQQLGIKNLENEIESKNQKLSELASAKQLQANELERLKQNTEELQRLLNLQGEISELSNLCSVFLKKTPKKGNTLRGDQRESRKQITYQVNKVLTSLKGNLDQQSTIEAQQNEIDRLKAQNALIAIAIMNIAMFMKDGIAPIKIGNQIPTKRLALTAGGASTVPVVIDGLLYKEEVFYDASERTVVNPSSRLEGLHVTYKGKSGEEKNK